MNLNPLSWLDLPAAIPLVAADRDGVFFYLGHGWSIVACRRSPFHHVERFLQAPNGKLFTRPLTFFSTDNCENRRNALICPN